MIFFYENGAMRLIDSFDSFQFEIGQGIFFLVVSVRTIGIESEEAEGKDHTNRDTPERIPVTNNHKREC